MRVFLQRMNEVSDTLAAITGVSMVGGVVAGVFGVAAAGPLSAVAVISYGVKFFMDNPSIQREGKKFLLEHEELEEYQGRTQSIVNDLEPAVSSLKQQVTNLTEERDELVVQVDALKEKISTMDALNADLQKEVAQLMLYTGQLNEKSGKLEELNERYEKAVEAAQRIAL